MNDMFVNYRQTILFIDFKTTKCKNSNGNIYREFIVMSERNNNYMASYSLAVTRTYLANERTLLAYIRTGITFIISGIGVIKFIQDGLYILVGGVALILTGITFTAYGIFHYYRLKHNI